MNYIDPVRFGIAGGFILGLTFFVATLLSYIKVLHINILIDIASFCPGYHVSALGSFVALFFGFIIGYFIFYFCAFLYNLLGPKR